MGKSGGLAFFFFFFFSPRCARVACVLVGAASWIAVHSRNLNVRVDCVSSPGGDVEVVAEVQVLVCVKSACLRDDVYCWNLQGSEHDPQEGIEKIDLLGCEHKAGNLGVLVLSSHPVIDLQLEHVVGGEDAVGRALCAALLRVILCVADFFIRELVVTVVMVNMGEGGCRVGDPAANARVEVRRSPSMVRQQEVERQEDTGVADVNHGQARHELCFCCQRQVFEGSGNPKSWHTLSASRSSRLEVLSFPQTRSLLATGLANWKASP